MNQPEKPVNAGDWAKGQPERNGRWIRMGKLARVLAGAGLLLLAGVVVAAVVWALR